MRAVCNMNNCRRLCPDDEPFCAEHRDKTVDWKTRAQAAEAESARLRKLIDRVIESAERALGDHCAPHDCYATGPLTGNPIADLVACPGCAQQNEIAAARSALQQKGGGL